MLFRSVLGVSTDSSCYYLRDYLRKDFSNNPVEVEKLQIFLRDLEGFANLKVTGVYDDATIAAVDAFQIRYKDEVLIPWGYDGAKGTDYAYILTKKKVNEIYCQKAFPVKTQEQQEIDATHSFFLSLRSAGIDVNNIGLNEKIPKALPGNSFAKTNNGTTGLTTLAGISSTTRQIATRLTANVIASGKKLANLALAFITWPLGSLFKNSLRAGGYTLGYNLSRMLNLFLILIVIVISYFWYKEYKNNKKIEDINKEIDLK